MREIFRALGAIAVGVALLQAPGNPARAQAPTPTKQMKLTAKQIEGFIAAQKKMADAKAEKEAEAIAKENGFASLDEIDDVEANIVLLMGSIDPQTKAFTEPPVLIKRRLEEIAADKSIPEADRNQELKELNEALKIAEPIKYPDNIELVKKYYERIQAALE